MQKASEDLIHEHEAILFTLKILEKMGQIVMLDKSINNRDIINIIDFLKIFADKCHHGKEEGFLFPALEEAGIPNENGPIGAMLAEHAEGRGYIKLMEESVSENILNKEQFVKASMSYVNLLRKHIEKENTVLFPIGDARFSNSKQEELIEKFERFEDEVIGKGKHEELHKMLQVFETKYLK